MVTLLIFFLVAMVMFSILLAIALFIKTAMILLPWTMLATGLGSLAAYLVGAKANLPPNSRPLVGGGTALVLVLVLGHAGVAIIPPKVPPRQNNNFDLVQPKHADLAGLTPIHLGVSAVIGAVGVAMILGSTNPKRLILELDDDPVTPDQSRRAHE